MKHIFLTLLLIAAASGAFASGFPKIASFWGCPPSTGDYDLWSRYGMLVCYESPYDDFIRMSRVIRELNPDAVILDTALSLTRSVLSDDTLPRFLLFSVSLALILTGTVPAVWLVLGGILIGALRVLVRFLGQRKKEAAR